LGKVGRAQMKFGRRHTTHSNSSPNMLFSFLQIGIFIALSRFKSSVSCPKKTPVYSTKNTGNVPKYATGGVARRYMHIIFPSLSLVVGLARRSAQCFGESWSGSDEVWETSHYTQQQLSKYAVFISPKSAYLSRYRATCHRYSVRNKPLLTAL